MRARRVVSWKPGENFYAMCVLDTVCLLANPQLCGRPVRGLDVRNNV